MNLESTSIALAANPANAMVTSTSRTWDDSFYPVGDRLTQIDVRLSKRIHTGQAGVMAMLDVYNLFNMAINTRHGTTAWLQPLSILPARLFKVGAQLDF